MSVPAPQSSGGNSGRVMPRGRPFTPGVSGNPGGRKPTPPAVREMARELTVEALETAAKCMRSPKAPWSARMQAVQTILDRGWGKPVQPVDVNDNRPLSGVPADRLIAAIQALVVINPPAESER